MGGVANAGAVFVYERVGEAWVEQAMLVASDAGAGDQLGSSVALDGDTILAGAPEPNSNKGAAYVFVRQGAAWIQEAKFVAPDGDFFDFFGDAVALDGDTAIVGAWWADTPTSVNAGAAYVFVRAGATWNLQQKLVASDGQPGDRFGRAVALEGDEALVGAPSGNGPSIADTGSAYVFSRSSGSWSEQVELVPAAALAGDEVGSDVDLEAGRALVGAPGADDPSWANVGSAWVFLRQGAAWAEEARLSAPDPLGEGFGTAVALSGDSALVGAPDPTDGAFESARLLRRDLGWTQALVLPRGDFPQETDAIRFGQALDLDGERALLGAPRDDHGGLTDVGSAFVLSLRTIGATFCDGGDGSLAGCPCANAGAADSGCDNAQATGGVRLAASGQDPATQLAFLLAQGFPPAGGPSVVLLRGRMLRTSPAALGDGLLCVDGSITRVGAGAALQGSYGRTISHGGGAGPGTFLYQAWYRNLPAAYCTPAGSNSSNGVVLVW